MDQDVFARVISAQTVIPLGIIIVGIFDAIFFSTNRGDKERTKRMLLKSVFTVYLLVLISFTVLPILIPPMHTEELSYNLNPLTLLYAFSDRATLIDISGNAVLFMPVAVLGYLCRFNCFSSLKHSAITSLVVSVLLEAVEGLETYFGFADFPAVVDVNDVIMNVIGGIVGYVIIKNYQSGRMKL